MKEYTQIIPLPNLTVYGSVETIFSPPKFENTYKTDIKLDIHSNKIRDYTKRNSSNRSYYFIFLPAVSLQKNSKMKSFFSRIYLKFTVTNRFTNFITSSKTKYIKKSFRWTQTQFHLFSKETTYVRVQSYTIN